MSNLRKMRTEARMSLDYVANRMGVHPSTIYSWERETSHPRYYQIRRLAGLFGCVESALGLTASDAPKPKPKPVRNEPCTAPTELYQRFAELSLNEQRYIIAYTTPEPYRVAVKRIREGRLTTDEAATITRMIEEYSSK